MKFIPQYVSIITLSHIWLVTS